MPEPVAPCLPGRRAQNVEARDRQICIDRRPACRGLLRREARFVLRRNRRSVAFLTSTDESANGVPSQVAPRGAARADDYLKEEETE
jgi:hypothetical protein